VLKAQVAWLEHQASYKGCATSWTSCSATLSSRRHPSLRWTTIETRARQCATSWATVAGSSVPLAGRASGREQGVVDGATWHGSRSAIIECTLPVHSTVGVRVPGVGSSSPLPCGVQLSWNVLVRFHTLPCVAGLRFPMLSFSANKRASSLSRMRLCARVCVCVCMCVCDQAHCHHTRQWPHLRVREIKIVHLLHCGASLAVSC